MTPHACLLMCFSINLENLSHMSACKASFFGGETPAKIPLNPFFNLKTLCWVLCGTANLPLEKKQAILWIVKD